MVRIIFVSFVVCLFSLPILSQQINNAKKQKLSKLYIAPSAGVEVLSIKKYENESKGYTVVYKGVPSVRLGFDASYKQTEKLIVHTGLFYSAKNFNRTETSNEGYSSYFYDQKFKNRYIETLIGGAFNFVSGRLDLGAYANFNFSYLLSATETRLTETGNKFINNNKPNFNKMLGVFEPGLNFNYNINYRLSVGLKTGYRLYLNSIAIDKRFTNNGALFQSGFFYKF